MLNLDLLFSVVLEKRSDQAPKLTSKAEWEGRRSHPRGGTKSHPPCPAPAEELPPLQPGIKMLPEGWLKACVLLCKTCNLTQRHRNVITGPSIS